MIPESPLPAGADGDGERVWAEDLEVVVPVYGVDDVPPPLETLLYAWQHTLVDVSPYVLPIIVAGAVGYGAPETAAMVSACLVVMGLATFANATWGNRLPSVLGPSATDTGAMATAGAIYGAPAMWMAGFIGGLFEILVGVSGVLRPLRRFLPPYVCGIVVLTIGISLARVAGGWVFARPDPRLLGLALGAVLSILVLTVIGHRCGFGVLARGALFFSLILFGVVIAGAMGLADFSAVARAPWFGLPRLFAFGGPGLGWQLAAGAVFGVLVGYVGSIAESIGDYAGTCAVSGLVYRVRHMRRGITVEGIASALGPLIGGLPLTTYSQNTGVIATTRVASRRVVQVAALILLLYGLSPKLGALLVLIPRPIVGAVFLVICGMIATVGLRLLACGPKDEAWLLTTAVTLIAALTLPAAAAAQQEWYAALRPFAKLFLGNAVVIAILLGILLNALFRAALPDPSQGPAPAARARSRRNSP